MMNIKAEIIGEFFDSLKNRCQNYLELMEGGDFVFDYVHCLTDWIKNQKKRSNKSYQRKKKINAFNML